MAAEAAGIFYAAETFVEGALVAAKGIYDPTLPLKATLQPIAGSSVRTHSHTASLVKGRVYLFGGLTVSDDGVECLADNDIHVIILPVSGVDETDYKVIKAGPEAPSARFAHSAAVLDDQIYIYGGSEVTDGAIPSDSDVVWAFNTTTTKWTKIQPEKSSAPPPGRLHAAAVATEHPKRATTRSDAGRLPQIEPDLTAADLPDPQTAMSYGTLIVHGGVANLNSDDNFSDVWTFDIGSRLWSPLPSPSLSTRAVAAPSLALVGSRLYTYSSGQVFFMDLTKETFTDKGGTGELGIAALGPWTSMKSPSNEVSPEERTGAALEVITTGQGRNYLALIGGETLNSTHQVPGDIWALQLRPEGMTAASFKDAARMAFKKDTGEKEWAEVRYFNSDDVLIQEGQVGRGIGPRTAFASSKDVDEDGGTIFVHGGKAGGKVLDDALLVTFSI